MTQQEFHSIEWNRGNVVRLNNGKEYPVKKAKKNHLLLWSAEYEAYFVVDYRIIVEQTSNFVDPEAILMKEEKARLTAEHERNRILKLQRLAEKAIRKAENERIMAENRARKAAEKAARIAEAEARAAAKRARLEARKKSDAPAKPKPVAKATPDAKAQVLKAPAAKPEPVAKATPVAKAPVKVTPSVKPAPVAKPVEAPKPQPASAAPSADQPAKRVRKRIIIKRPVKV